MNNIKLIAFDLDGTLLHPLSFYELVNKKYIEMLQEFYNNGIELCIVTGRGLSFAKKVTDEIGVECHIICFNGAFIPSINYSSIIDGNTILKLEKEVNKIMYYSLSSKIYVKEENISFYMKDYENRYKKNPLTCEEYVYDDEKLKEEIDNNQIAKIIINDNLQNKDIKGINIITKISGKSLEIVNENVSKGVALKMLINSLQINENDVIVVGDDSNDCEMFKMFENSFIVNHEYNKCIEMLKYRINSMIDLKKYIKF